MSEWQPIETGPKKPRRKGHGAGPLVYLLIPYSKKIFSYSERWDVGYWQLSSKCWRFTGDDGEDDIQPTHWAYLMEPPEPVDLLHERMETR